MNTEKQNELKKVLRAILIAEKSNGMPLRVLEREYSEMEGRSMPLFGYPDTAALMNSLSDTVFIVCYCTNIIPVGYCCCIIIVDLCKLFPNNMSYIVHAFKRVVADVRFI